MNDSVADQVDERLLDKSHIDEAPSAGPSCKADMWVEVKLSFTPDDTHIALIEWTMSENYPTSALDEACGPVVTLYAYDEKLVEKACETRCSITPWITGVPFAPGLNARIYDADCQSRSSFLLCKTKTPSSPTDPQSCKADMSVEVDLLQDSSGKNALVHYKISEIYPRSTFPGETCGPMLALYLEDKLLSETRPLRREGTWNAFEDYRKGLNAHIYDWDCMSQSRFLLCKTNLVP